MTAARLPGCLKMSGHKPRTGSKIGILNPRPSGGRRGRGGDGGGSLENGAEGWESGVGMQDLLPDNIPGEGLLAILPPLSSSSSSLVFLALYSPSFSSPTRGVRFNQDREGLHRSAAGRACVKGEDAPSGRRAHTCPTRTPLHSTLTHSAPLHSTPRVGPPLHSTPLHSPPFLPHSNNSTPLHSAVLQGRFGPWRSCRHGWGPRPRKTAGPRE